MLDVVNLFREQDTRDELGTGTIRDGLADMLFPGTSTVQTRARYFLFIGWMYRQLEERTLNSGEVGRLARREEIRLIDVLADSDDPEGTIGIQARARLERLASNIYWQGLGSWGIRLYPGSQEQYHRAIATGLFAGDDEGVRGASSGWHSGLPAPPGGFPNDVSMALTEEEGAYLSERIISHHPTTLLAWLVAHGRREDWVEFVWEHPQLDEFPARQTELISHARIFSEVFHGAALLYNLMLAEMTAREDWASGYRLRLADWGSVIAAREDELQSWSLKRFWEILDSGHVRYSRAARYQYVEPWVGLVRQEGAAAIESSAAARALVRTREAVVKRGRARLTNPGARALWQGESGTRQLSFRWPTAQTQIDDILSAREHHGA